MNRIGIVAGRLGMGLTLVLVWGCAIVDPHPNVPLRTQAPPADGASQACMAALAVGELVVHPASGVGLRDVDGNVIEVVWPFGYSARLESGRITLMDERGTVVGREGDVVGLGGGEIGRSVWLACGGVAPVDP